MDNSKEAIFDELKKVMAKLFEMDQAVIVLESRLYEDLDLDSIDAVDLVVHLQPLVDEKFQPAEFKMVRTVGDVVDVIHAKLAAK